MNYKKAKQLKDAGFPGSQHISCNQCKYFKKEKKFIHIPTLGEIIEELAKKEISFKLRQTYSIPEDKVFYVIEIPNYDDMERCDTPLEAVANLYIKLNKKK